jgi:hypothetical protein
MVNHQKDYRANHGDEDAMNIEPINSSDMENIVGDEPPDKSPDDP